MRQEADVTDVEFVVVDDPVDPDFPMPVVEPGSGPRRWEVALFVIWAGSYCAGAAAAEDPFIRFACAFAAAMCVPFYRFVIQIARKVPASEAQQLRQRLLYREPTVWERGRNRR